MSKLYQNLCLPVTLYGAWKVVKKKNSAGGIDGLSVLQFEEKLAVNLDALRKDLMRKAWNPEPYLRVNIAKNAVETRKIGLLSVRDKIVQQALKTLIEPRMEKLFLNNSYGYRPGRGPLRAINRVVHIMKQMKNGYIAKLDIDDYFDTIQHERLFIRLQNFLQDEEMVRLIRLCVKTGSVDQQFKWDETGKGVPQGAVLSPLLANFYLHPFDQFVIAQTPNYVRYADDFSIIASNMKEMERIIQQVSSTLKEKFFLSLNPTQVKDFDEGVEFLGILIKESGLSLTEKKKERLLERIQDIKFQDVRITTRSLETLQGIMNYYGRLLPQSLLKDLDSGLLIRIHEWIKEESKKIRNKTQLEKGLQEIPFFADETNLSRPMLIRGCIMTYRDKCKEEKETSSKVDNKKLIAQKKREYRKLETEGSELVISTPGCFIGKSGYGITVKLKNQLLHKKSTNALKHITVIGQGVTFSTNAMMHCVSHNIPVDFFDATGKHCASVLAPVSIDKLLWHKQASLPEEKSNQLAARIVLSKIKNQQNLIKYYHKYHKETELLRNIYPEIMLRMNRCVHQVKIAVIEKNNTPAFLMSCEAVAAVAYWDYVRLLISDDGVDFFKRERKGATDLMNSLLNYGYALLYARVWNAVLAQKLNPAIGVLHAPQPNKPVFVFDIVEMFRAQAVDRIVISLIQQGEPLHMNKNLLSDATKQLLIKNVLERFNRYEKYRSEQIRFIEVIHRQTKEIADFMTDEIKTFKPYIARW